MLKHNDFIYLKNDSGYNVWHLTSIWNYSKLFPSQSVSLDIFDLETDRWFQNQEIPTIRNILKHYNRAQNADLSYPIIIYDTNIVIDGMHRILKKLIRNEDKVEAILLHDFPPPDFLVLDNLIPDRKQEIKFSLTRMKQDFYMLLEQIKPDFWTKESKQEGWLIGLELLHIVEGLDPFISMAIESARNNEPLKQTPKFLGHPENHQSQMKRILNGNITKNTLIPIFELAFQQVLLTLESISEQEWDLTTYNNHGVWTIEELFKSLPKHFHTHAQYVIAVL